VCLRSGEMDLQPSGVGGIDVYPEVGASAAIEEEARAQHEYDRSGL
jgi:hypothetical protein